MFSTPATNYRSIRVDGLTNLDQRGPKGHLHSVAIVTNISRKGLT